MAARHLSFDQQTWRKLIGPALRVIDSLETNGYGRLDWRLGGGTVLMLRFDHQLSKDIDIFTYDAQALNYLSPRLNLGAEREAESYEEHANVVKLVLGDGDINFIVTAPVIPDAHCETIGIEGRAIVLEGTAEILAKKLMFRADSFKGRDVFDMVVALSLDEPAALAALRATVRTRPALLARLAAMAATPGEELTRDILVTEAGRCHVAGMVPTLQAALAGLAS